MSLKARLRIAISLLMAMVVTSLSVMYVHGFLLNEFKRTSEVARSIAGQVQGATLSRFSTLAAEHGPANDIKEFLLQTATTDQPLDGMLHRALNNWNIISEVFLTDSTGRVIASTEKQNLGRPARRMVQIDNWDRRSVFANTESVLFSDDNLERQEPLAMNGENKPFVIIHVVISLAILKEALAEPLGNLGYIFIFSLAISLLLSLMLPNFVVDPLERLSARLDMMEAGTFSSNPGARREAKEVAAVYSKLDILGQRYIGARDKADALRTNVEHLLERLEQAVLLVDPSGQLIMAGRHAGSLLGVNPPLLQGRMLFDVVQRDSDLGLLLDNAIQQREAISDEVVTIHTPDGKRVLSIACEPLVSSPDNSWLGSLITLHDAESRGRIKAELGLAERLTALGRLTGGVAHEIKNPLNAITLHLEMLRNRIDEEAPELDVISREISRLDRVVKTFLDFNRPIEPHMRIVDLSEMARDLARLMAPQAQTRSVTVDLSAPEPAPIFGDLDLLQQAVLNVITNALEAMPNGGSLRITARRGGGYSEIIVSDTGTGIPDAIKDRIFNLYFTTKTRGSGIGLAMVFRFVQLHDGKLECSTERGRGTTFRFIFPEAVSAPRAPEPAARSHNA